MTLLASDVPRDVERTETDVRESEDHHHGEEV
jgi:hypothetical protein